ncbi:Protein kinase catalytic domain C family protein [Babesia bovis T2Bo]|uniref:Protein kinase catalytic domain C family protein n=1 Tax=Babesia bovis T2Bo TaxID=484906 RepID=UPI001C34EAD3|nr:Protein kinase catalytic domain C family protein [Babesia bovis T2Bo]EDO06393.2 Protein kinase catalytic domain C family protein [Babesia bovis T2Bo]
MASDSSEEGYLLTPEEYDVPREVKDTPIQANSTNEDVCNVEDIPNRSNATKEVTQADLTSSDNDEESKQRHRSSTVSPYPSNSTQEDYSRTNSDAGNQERNNRSIPDFTQNDITAAGVVVTEMQACRNVEIYKCLNKISEGTYGSVYRALDTETGNIVALKHIKYHEGHWKEGFPVSYLREISILLELRHPNVLSVKEVVTNEARDQYYVVMEYVEHELKTLLHDGKPDFTLSERKCLLYQLLRGVEYLHSHWVLHRDLKTTNILYNNKGVLKICDFGMARKFGRPLKNYTQNVVTHWYRAPELFLGQNHYDEAVDMWSVGCIFAEIICGKPMFTGSSDADTLDKIFRCCGTPNNETWPGFSELRLVKEGKFPISKHKPNFHAFFKNNLTSNDQCYMTEAGLDLLMKMLTLNPSKRISAKEAMEHPYLTTEKPRTQAIELMPTIPDTNAKIRVKRSPDEESNKMSRFAGRVNPVKFLALMERNRSKKTSRQFE